ncbi:5-oxoprolinase subunit C family protein [Williamsia sterculiae]|uniref:Biotin-dependent carboxylase uncharacterized domain-containing protein n=1 Tax=Williamsia sterculiae TaxID=1344003 RepID=A0A1N7DE56_9NOCA|nr:biotin-dependent carboxyltransferase family protein [Williamsia sterculiae]SIR74101.1 biotin-dependent carboxylase uncharacterized domain-containing protein [Williamsia sterculiae]
MTGTRALSVSATGPGVTVQDLGRPGYAHLGVPLSGAADRSSLRLANRLVGNRETAAALEITLGGLRAEARGLLFVVVTGASGIVRVDGTPVGHSSATAVQHGQMLTVDAPTDGVRSYLAVRGGIDVTPVLGSRSTDVLSGLGPEPVVGGTVLAIGTENEAWPSTTDAPREGSDPDQTVFLYAELGPRTDRVVDAELLFRGEWTVNPHSDRVGVRLDRIDDGPQLRHRDGLDAIPSEGIAYGSVQIPPSGQPVVFLADHPVTGGYPVIAVLRADSVDRAAQLAPGRTVRFIKP